jgi:hypothetical protein
MPMRTLKNPWRVRSIGERILAAFAAVHSRRRLLPACRKVAAEKGRLYRILRFTFFGGIRFMATIRFLDPRATVNPKDRPLVLGMETLEGKTIGIIDNGQANSTTMFQELAQLIQEKFHAKEVIFKTKPTHMQGAPKAIMEEILNRCDAVITGLGA